jgi:iron complex transport system permease protein
MALAVSLAGLIVLALVAGPAVLTLAHLAGASLRALGIETTLPAMDEAQRIILTEVRIPRVLLAAVVGGCLAVVGAILQNLFQNPMADASLLGVGSGAALGAVVAVSRGWSYETFFALPMAAFAGAVIAIALVYVVAHAAGEPSLSSLLLTGLAVSAFLSGLTSILLIAAEEFRVRAVFFWLAGGLEGRGYTHLLSAASIALPAAALVWLLSRPLDALSLGDQDARAIGVSVHRFRLLFLGLAALISGAITAVAGAVPFVGLMAPHALRSIVGNRASTLLPAAFLAGASLVVAADAVARGLSDRYDLPLGALTSLLGAPYFLVVLRREAGRV